MDLRAIALEFRSYPLQQKATQHEKENQREDGGAHISKCTFDEPERQ